MKRAALIVGASGGDLPGVAVDVASYRSFLLSPLGGAWLPSEIVTLDSPSSARVSIELEGLALASYSVTIFAGHGHHPIADGSTRVVVRPGEELDSDVLRQGAPKHTLILDCCRALAKAPLTEDVLAKASKRELTLNPPESRRYYDRAIEACEPGLVVMFACGIDESAGDSAHGGYYSSSILLASQRWRSGYDIDLQTHTATLSVKQAHDKAAERVRVISGNRQNPTIEHPRSSKHFPFAILA